MKLITSSQKEVLQETVQQASPSETGHTIRHFHSNSDDAIGIEQRPTVVKTMIT